MIVQGLGSIGPARAGFELDGRRGYVRAGSTGVGGFFDEIGDVFEKVRDVVEDVVTLKHLRKGLSWAWRHMPKEMRVLVMKIGPIVAGMYGGPWAKQAAELAIALLEQDRYTKAERKRFRAELQKQIDYYEAEGLLQPGVVNVNNPEHLEAIVLAGNMPPDVVDDWFRQRGLSPPAPPRKALALKPAVVALGAAALLIAAGTALQKRSAGLVMGRAA